MEDILWGQNVSYTAREDRGLFAAMFDEGVENWRSFKVTQRAAGVTMSVDVAAGRAVVTGDDQANQGNYICRETTAPTNLAIAAQGGATSRYDKIVLKVNDPDAGGSAGNNSVLMVVQGTAGSPGVPPATPASAILLATVGPITVSTANITDSIIVDGRVLWGERLSPPGTIKYIAGTHVPNGWLQVDGSAQSRTGLADLFAEIGTQYGAGDGTTTYNLPDLRGKIGIPAKAGQAEVDTIGETGGNYTKALVEANLPPHAHGMTHTHPIDPPSTSPNYYPRGPGSSIGSAAGNDFDTAFIDIPSFTSGASSAATTGNGSGTSTPVDVMQPYQVIGMAIIRT